MSQRTPMKTHAVDAVNGTFATSLITATLAGWSIQEWAAFAALFYSMLLILDKLGILAPVKSGIRNAALWVWVKAVHRGK